MTGRARRIATTNTSLVSLGIGLVAIYWLADSISRTLIFREGDLMEHVLSSNPLELWPRLVVGAVFMGCGFYGQIIIRKLKRTQGELKNAKMAAEAATQTKSEFLANMSHEIRTPMAAILGYGEMMMDPDQTGEERDECLAIVRRNGEHLLELINDILDISKIEASKFMVDARSCSIPAVVADVISMMQVRAHQKGISLSVEYTGPLPATIMTDPARVRQALVNLVGNAVKFTDEGGVRVVVSFLDQWRKDAAAVRIQVIDTGIGIEPKALEQLFQPFVQADASTSRKYGGTGLGLVITRHIAKLLDGNIEVQSEPGKGSTFTLTIPAGRLDGVEMLDNPAEVVQQEARRSAAPIAQVLTGLRVLLAEDGEDNQRLIGTILRKAGAEVEVASNGVFAVAKGISDEFDVILMDMQMPEMDGYQATASLRRQGHKGPILALTAHGLASDRDRCITAGCTDYLVKPIDRVKLIAAVGEHGGAEPDRRVPEASEAAPDAQDVIICQMDDDCDMAEVVDCFVAGLGSRTAAMREAIEHGCFEEVCELAHRLKGSGGSFGYPELTEAAREIEAAAEAKDAEGARLALARLESACRAVVNGRGRRRGVVKEADK